MWCVYCHTASTTTSGASGGILAENFHPALLAVYEPVALLGVAGVPPAHVAALAADGIHDRFLDAGLRRPAHLVGGQAQISAGYNDNGVGHALILTPGAFCASSR